MAYFPTLSKKEDSSYFTESREDPTIRSKMDGGYMVTRPRHTRTPRRLITTGFTDLPDSDKQALESFYIAVAGGSSIFTYIHPVSGEEIYVRFAAPFTFSYAGVGEAKRWDVRDIKMEEV